MKNFLQVNQLFGTVGSPNQTGETQTKENRVGLMSYLRRTIMLLFAVLVMSIANVGVAWGTMKALYDGTADVTVGFRNDEYASGNWSAKTKDVQQTYKKGDSNNTFRVISIGSSIYFQQTDAGKCGLKLGNGSNQGGALCFYVSAKCGFRIVASVNVNNQTLYLYKDASEYSLTSSNYAAEGTEIAAVFYPTKQTQQAFSGVLESGYYRIASGANKIWIDTIKLTSYIPVTSISISPSPAQVAIGRRTQLRANVSPANASLKTVTWSVKSGGTYVSVDSKTGVVRGLAAGDAVITATANDGSGVTQDVNVSVTAINCDTYSGNLFQMEVLKVCTCTIASGSTYALTDGDNYSVYGGTLSLNNKGNDQKVIVSKVNNSLLQWYLNTGNVGYDITLADCNFKKGDIISISSTESNELYLNDGSAKGTSTDATTSSLSYTVDDGDAFIGKNRIVIWKGSTSTYIRSITISRTASSCEAPSSVSVAPTTEDGNYGWRYTTGEALKLTATATGGSGGSYTYQWKKKTGESTWKNLTDGVDATDGGTFSGTTSANLVISGLTAGNAGTYKCVVSTGLGCDTESNEFWVRVFTLDGNYSGEDWIKNPIVWTDEYNGTATVTLDANSVYQFKVTDNDSHWYGLTSPDIYKDEDNFVIYRNDANNVALHTGKVAGTYTFTVNVYHANDNENPKITLTAVRYPKMTIYMSGGSTTWCDANPVFFAHTYGQAPNDVMMSAHACESGLFYADVPSYNTKVTFTRQKTGSSSIAWSGDNFWNKSKDEIVIGSNNKFTCTGWDNNEGVFSGSSYSPSTYTISFAANGGSGSMSSISSIACDANQTITANAFTKTGYNFTGWKANVDVKVNDETVTAGTVIADEKTIQNIRSNITLTAQWSVKSYDLTWNLGGGTTTSAGTGIASGVSSNTTSSIAFGTSLSAPTVTKTGYNFSSWSPLVASTMPAANTTYTAQWTANKYNVTHTLSHVTRSSGGEAGSNKATYGTAYSVVFAADGGYTLPDAVTVTVGGSDITANCTWDQGTGILTIPAAYVTGNIVITVTGEEESSVGCSAEWGDWGSPVVNFPTNTSSTIPGDVDITLTTTLTAESTYHLGGGTRGSAYHFENGEYVDISINKGEITAVSVYTWNKCADVFRVQFFSTTSYDAEAVLGYQDFSGTGQNNTDLQVANAPAGSKFARISRVGGACFENYLYRLIVDAKTAPTLTALEDGTRYDVADMVPAGTTISSTEQTPTGLSANTKFYLVGPTAMAVKDDAKTVDGISFANSYYFQSAATLSSNTPTDRAIKFIIPSAGTLTAWVRQSAKVCLSKEGVAGSALGSGNSDVYDKYTADVTAGTYYLYATGGFTTLYAVKFDATAATYSIAYDCDGATSGCPSNVAEATNLPNPLPDAPVKTGYVFGGWYTNSGKTTPAVAGAALTGNTTLYAKWTINSHTLTWNFNGGSTSDESYTAGGTKTYGTAIIYPANNTMSKEGYDFDGWDSDASTMPDENLTITAQWTAKTTTITINANTSNHGSTAPSPITATYGSALPSFTDAAGESGYSLTGYFTAATEGDKIINADGTLVASTDYADGSGNWKYETATLTLYPQYEAAPVGATVEWGDWGSPIRQFPVGSADNYNGIILTPSASIDELSYVWAGGKDDYDTYNMNVSGKYADITLTSGVISSVSFAVWTADNTLLKIQFCKEATYSDDPADLLGDPYVMHDPEQAGSGLQTINAPANAKSARIYKDGSDHWQCYLYRLIVTSSAGCASPETATFDKGAATSGSVESIEACAGSEFTMPDQETMSYPGYLFTGWKLDNAGELITAGTSYTMPAGGASFTAQWSPFVVPVVTGLEIDGDYALTWSIPGKLDLSTATLSDEDNYFIKYQTPAGSQSYNAATEELTITYTAAADYQKGVAIPFTGNNLESITYDYKGHRVFPAVVKSADEALYWEYDVVTTSADWTRVTRTPSTIYPNEGTVKPLPTAKAITFCANPNASKTDEPFYIRNVFYHCTGMIDVDHVVLMRKEGSAATDTTEAGTATRLYSGKLSHYTDETAVAGKAYYYTVFSVHADGSVSAGTTVEKAVYIVTHSDAENGSYTIKVGDASATDETTTANYEQTVTLVATPSSGYVIDGWNVTGATVGNNNIASTTFTMPAGNVTVAPTFKLMPNVYYYQDGTRYASSTYKAPDGSVASSGNNQAINSGNEWTVSNSISGLTVSAKGCTYDGKSGSEIHETAYLKVPKDGNASNKYVKFVVAAGYKATSLKMKIGGYSSNPAVTLKPYTTELGDAISYTGTVGGVATKENNFNEISWSNLAAGTYYLNVGTNAYISEITAQTEQVGYTVSFAVDGGSTGYGTVSPSSITEVTHGSTVSISENVLTLKETAVTATPTAESDEYTYAFDSWSVSDGASITSAQTITASFTSTAKEYTLTWDLNGGKVSTAGTAAAVDETEPSGSVAYNTALTAPVVTKSGYDFAGWTPSVADNMPAANTTYTAQWAERFTVTYNAMTGSVDPTSATGSTANKVSLPEPTKDGYDFDGWYNTAGEKIGDAGDKYGPTAAITLYAKWKGSCAGSDKSVRFTTSDKNDAGSYYDDLSSGDTQLVGNGKAKMIATGDCKISATSNKDGYRSDRCAIVFKFTKTTALDIYYCAGSSSRSFALYSFSSDKALADIAVSDYETESAVTSVTGVKAAFANTTATSSNPSISSGTVATSGSGGGIKVTYSSLSAGYYVLLAVSGEGYFYGFDIDGGANPCYQVTYHGNNATSGYVNDPAQYAADADPYVKYNTNGYERTGYEFVGWNTAANGSGTPYAEGAQITDIAADVNLYAQWRILIEGTNEDFAGYTSVTSADDIRLAEGATLTIKSTRTIHDIILETGSTLNVNTTNGDGTGDGVTLTVHSLSLKGGLNSSCTAYDMPRVYINSKSSLEKSESTVNFDISVDQRNYYPIAVPFPVEVAEVDYVNSTMATYSIYGKHFVIKEYDGASRAENGAIDDNWKVVSNTAGTKLQPGKGYILTAISKPAYGGGVIRFPMSFTDAWTTKGEQATVSAVTKNTVAVEAYEGTATEGGKNSNKGWNMLGVPYMSCFDASDASTSPSDAFIKGKLNFITGEYTDAENVYVSVPTSDFSEYIQKPVSEAVLLPGWCFFVQVSENATVSFAAAGQEDDSSLPIYAPKREQAMPTVKTGIILSSETASDKTTILVSDKYSVTDYEINADLEKMFGNGYTLATYSLAGTTRLVYNAMSNSDATNVIPIGYRAPADGEYTFAINPRYAENGAFEHVNLIDYETGFVTDLLVSSYSFATERTQNDERFALNVVKAPQTATDITVTGDGLQVTGPQKVIINDKLYIIVDGKMYDAKGVMVK